MRRLLNILLLSVVGFTLSSCSDSETKEREKVLGYAGRAKKNPYLAAERYLKADGREVSSSSGALSFSDDDEVVIAPASSVKAVADSERVLNWVSEGGHFVCFLERAEDYWQDVGEWADHSPDRWSDEKTQEDGLEQLLVNLEVERVEEEEEPQEDSESEDSSSEEKNWNPLDPSIAKGLTLPKAQVVQVDVGAEESYKMQLGGLGGLKVLKGIYYEDDWQDDGKVHRFLSRSYGDGRVTFISDGRAFRNPYLKIEQHAEVLDFLASGSTSVAFSLGKVRSFTSMLGEYAWMALYGLLLVTALWLWKNIPRFGPLLDVSDGHSRNYDDQVKNTGQFLWKHKNEQSLLQPLRDAVLRKLGHGFSQESDTQVLIAKLSAASGLDSETVSEAMTRDEVRDANSMVRISKNLQQLLKSL